MTFFGLSLGYRRRSCAKRTYKYPPVIEWQNCHQWMKWRPPFPSLCYFQMQPTGRRTRMEVGNRPYSRVRGLNRNNSETPNPTAESNSAHLRPFSSRKNTVYKKWKINLISHHGWKREAGFRERIHSGEGRLYCSFCRKRSLQMKP